MTEKLKKNLLIALDLFVNVVIILILVIVVQVFMVAPFKVSGASMCDTINFINEKCEHDKGETVLTNKALYMFNNPSRGEIIVFKSKTEGDKYFIKRVIGLPGETIEIKNGEVYITNTEGETKQIEEAYLNESNRHNTETYNDYRVFEVPENSYFVMGDNRGSSTDSRSCFASSPSKKCKENPENAFIEKEEMSGKAWIVIWPPKNMRKLEVPSYSINSESLEEK